MGGQEEETEWVYSAVQTSITEPDGSGRKGVEIGKESIPTITKLD